jgi:hypothetical protein
VKIGRFLLAINDHPGEWKNHVYIGDTKVDSKHLEDHAAFDEWVCGQWRAVPFQPDHYDIIKGIDRGFWLRYANAINFLSSESHMAKASQETRDALAAEKIRSGCGYAICPFGNPLPNEPRAEPMWPQRYPLQGTVMLPRALIAPATGAPTSSIRRSFYADDAMLTRIAQEILANHNADVAGIANEAPTPVTPTVSRAIDDTVAVAIVTSNTVATPAAAAAAATVITNIVVTAATFAADATPLTEHDDRLELLK